ncbi:MAG: CvpA family protein [Pirellulales bacterium]|nr:CvpA family protein [Pirellulales bacterium]
MDWYDILMLTVLGGATIFGAWKGMAWQLASVASLVLSYFVCLKFSASLAPMFGDSAPWNRFAAMLVLYLATGAGVWLAFRLVAGLLDRIKLRDFDHQIGAIFGLLKGILLCLAITFFALTLWPTMREHILQSKSGRAMAVLLDKADAVMPPELHDVIGPYLHKLEDGLDPNAPQSAGNQPPGDRRSPENASGNHAASDPSKLWVR